MTNQQITQLMKEAGFNTRHFNAYSDEFQAFAQLVRNATLAEPAVEPRPVTPYTCPKCHALWLHWPSEQTGIDTDTLNCRSAKWCDYCEKGGVEQLKRLERVPASLKAPVREPSPPPPAEVPLLSEPEIAEIIKQWDRGTLKDLIADTEAAVRRKAGL